MISTQISPDVAALVGRLITSKPGDDVVYADLNTAVGRDVVKTARYLVLRALDVAARDHGAVFANIKGVGYRRLAPEDAHTLGATARESIRRKSRKARKRILSATSRVNHLDAESARKTNAELSVLGVIEHVTHTKSARPVASHETAAEPVAITMQRLLREMGGGVASA